MNGYDFAKAAEQLAGTQFRLHGRDPRTGLDCIGLLEATLAACGINAKLPVGYSLRTGSWNGLESYAAHLGFAPTSSPVSPGDICLLRPSPAQMHFGIASTAHGLMVEAHAGLRRVVLSPIPDAADHAGRWRFAPVS